MNVDSDQLQYCWMYCTATFCLLLFSGDNRFSRNQAITEKNGLVAATKLRTTNKFFLAATKNFAAAFKPFADRTKHFVVVTKYFCYPYCNK